MRQSGTKTLVTEEPYAFIAHVRVCGGAGWVTTGSTRKPTPNSLCSCLAPAIGRGSPLAFGVNGKEKREDDHVVEHRRGHREPHLQSPRVTASRGGAAGARA